MKRAVVTGIVCALLVAGVAWATQTWRDNESMGGFSLTDPTHAGGGPLCAQYDNTGKLTSAGAPCGAGLGGSAGVSSVTGTSGQILAAPTTGAVVVSLVATSVTPGGYTNMSATVDGLGRLTAASSGTSPVTSVGATAPITTTGGTTPTIGISLPSGQAAYGTGTNVTSNSAFTYATGTDDALTVLSGGGTNQTASLFISGNSGGGFFRGYGSTFVVPSLANHVAFGSATSNGSNGIVIFGNDSLTSGGSAATSSVSLRGGGYDTAAEDILLDVDGSHFTDGRILMTEITAPPTPASGILTCYGDNSSLNWACKDQLGNVKHGVRTTTATASQFFTALSDSGQFSRAQPAFTDLSGSAICAQLPALTGADGIASAGGTCTVTNSNKGKIYVDATDAAAHSPDYLFPKLTSFTNTISFSPIGAGDGQLTVDVVPGTSQTMFWSWNMTGPLSNSNEFLCEGGSNLGTETCSQYPLLHAFGHVTWTINIVNNADTGTPSWTVTFWKNGSPTAVTGTFTVGTSIGVISMGTSALSLAVGDVVGLVYNGTGFVSGQSTAMVTARFDP